MSPSLITDESHEACPVPSQSHIRRMEKTYGLRIEAAFHPFGLIGGDFWGIVPIDRHRYMRPRTRSLAACMDVSTTDG